MSNVAYADFGNQRRQERSTVANLEDGYTRIANDLFEAVMCADLTARQLKVVMAIIRKTYGFGKKLDRITNTQIAEMTGIHHTHVCKAKNEMIAMNIVISSGNKIGINKDFTEWNFNISQVSETLAKSANKTLAKTANSHKPSQLNTKETITKEKKESNTPLTPHEVKGGESVKPTKRKSTPINYDEYLNAYNEEVGDRLPHAVEANEKRKTRIRKIIKNLATANVDGWRAYVRAFVRMAKPFYFGENDTGWTADIDYLLRETTLTGVREGKFADRGF
ncbi:TPA: replication protein [Proteus mirabilis]|uniref:Bacteriophage replication protein O n=2 Tax=Proteus TaxID=583 RepID=A0A0G4Q2Z1_9GAMM|nr:MULTISPECIES: replication protein [Proteus]MBG3085318.1 replication protein [Proteus mirabilis]MBG5948022.1 replication protein [Proteus mirabilis]MBI6456555.1 replication protein [Proteus mirabilis]MCI9744031.1 replication protein [Proteus mirabilis]MCI9801794.1 replication protein [Proteus mirabilis]